ncbi:type II toxin-antitoxin system VapC family toxin [Sphingobium sp. V4]|uniref:type II toxin-antitoxin system VapC family toxin n=1 Tax=Sphingobium sp. V4 TaxID=3038927 RepID=UPI0025583678|nr:type II toxin-antitoxin system VapC family toxin [Sphingobium sp. V4]WIW89626.1 type II toxin-antitoxin system VapC family toxin [Sphingobium sp. V4]
MIGWLLDTNVIATLINPNGAPSVKAWASEQAEDRFFLSILTLGEYDKGIHGIPVEHAERSRYMGARDALEARFRGRILSLDDQIVRRWGEISGDVKLRTGHTPSVVDTMLAATAIEHRLYLVTRNVKDVRHSGAAIFNPWDDDPATLSLS